MKDLQLTHNLKEEVRKYFLRIKTAKHELKGQKTFMSSISPQLQTEAKSIIFTKLLQNTRTFVALQLNGRRQYQNLKGMSNSKKIVDLHGYPDTRFKRMLEFIVNNIEIKYAKPEERIVQQDDSFLEEENDDGEMIRKGYFMCVILKGTFSVEL